MLCREPDANRGGGLPALSSAVPAQGVPGGTRVLGRPDLESRHQQVPHFSSQACSSAPIPRLLVTPPPCMHAMLATICMWWTLAHSVQQSVARIDQTSRNLWCSRAQVTVAQSGAVAGLIKVLENGSGQAQGAATEALRNLSIDPACCRQISQAAGVGPFHLSLSAI